jgi:hypothetical protein
MGKEPTVNNGKTVFAQVIDFLPKRQFRCCVERYQGNYRIRSFTSFDRFYAWPLPSSLIAKVCVTLNAVYAP